MRSTAIAPAAPFEGAPRINLASVFGASPGKPILLRIPATGVRPIEFRAEGLPEGLVLQDHILSGTVRKAGSYRVTVAARNELGETEKQITLEIAPGNVLVTPLLGYTHWNAFDSAVTQKDMETAADRMVALGISEYGYSYVNIDSGWQGRYGGEFDAIMPNEKFPDMERMTRHIHALGLKCGIYSTPMETAWGCPQGMGSIPGCTRGEPDIRFPSAMGGIGTDRCEANNVRQWDAWGFDYLKYDWYPTDTVNAEIMRQELLKAKRDFAYCVTAGAPRVYHEYWSRFCQSYRSNPDSVCTWENLLAIYRTYFDFMPHWTKGHYFDLDMLDIGNGKFLGEGKRFTEEESLVAYSMRAFLGSPIQISSDLTKATDFELAVYCNEEVIAIHQDCAFRAAKPILRTEEGERIVDVLEKELEDGAYAYAFFNLGETVERITADFPGPATARDVWAKEDVPHGGNLALRMPPHTVRIFRCPQKSAAFSVLSEDVEPGKPDP